MTQFCKRLSAALAALTLAAPLMTAPPAWAQPRPPTIPNQGQPGQQYVYYLYVRGGPDRPWVQTGWCPSYETAQAQADQYRRLGYEIFIRKGVQPSQPANPVPPDIRPPMTFSPAIGPPPPPPSPHTGSVSIVGPVAVGSTEPGVTITLGGPGGGEQPPTPPPPPPPPPGNPPFILPPLPEVLFGATDPDAVVKGRYYAVNPDGSTGAVLGTFTVVKDVFKMFPAGGDEIQVAVNDAPMGGVLATDYAHYATPPVDPLVVRPKANGGVRLGPDHENTPHDYYSRSSGTLNFALGGPTVDAVMQQRYRTVAPEGFARTIEERSQPATIRFIPDSFGVQIDE